MARLVLAPFLFPGKQFCDPHLLPEPSVPAARGTEEANR